MSILILCLAGVDSTFKCVRLPVYMLTVCQNVTLKPCSDGPRVGNIISGFFKLARQVKRLSMNYFNPVNSVVNPGYEIVPWNNSNCDSLAANESSVSIDKTLILVVPITQSNVAYRKSPIVGCESTVVIDNITIIKPLH